MSGILALAAFAALMIAIAVTSERQKRLAEKRRRQEDYENRTPMGEMNG